MTRRPTSPFARLVRSTTGESIGPVRGAEVRMEVYKHTVARVDVPGFYFNLLDPYEPVELTLGLSGGTQRTIYGYVDHTDGVETPGSGAASTVVWMIGASGEMKTSVYRVYRNTRISALISEVATEFGLASQVDDDGRVYTVAAASGPAWEFLCEQAKRAGLLLWADGAILEAGEPGATLARRRSVAGVYSANSSSGMVLKSAKVQDEVGTRDFADRYAFSVNDTGAVIAVRDSYNSLPLSIPGPRPSLGRIVHSTATSLAELESDTAHEGAQHRFPYVVSGVISGDPTLRPMGAAGIVSSSARVAGHWLVTKTVHRASPTGITTEFEGRRATAIGTSVAGRALRGATPANKPRLVNGRWRP